MAVLEKRNLTDIAISRHDRVYSTCPVCNNQLTNKDSVLFNMTGCCKECSTHPLW